MVPFFALTLFAGIRPDFVEGEISKLLPKHILMETGVILIEPEVSKVNEKRTITIQANLREWLLKYPLERYPIQTPKRFCEMWTEIRNRFNLSHDVLRHTYISMLVAKTKSVGDAALQAGNSEAVVRKHYLNLKSEKEAEAFWGITPKIKDDA
jgi:integrase